MIYSPSFKIFYFTFTNDRSSNSVCFSGSDAFNRAMLMNVGYVEALKERPFDCFIFHDVDLLPENDRNLYTCPEQPRHMSVAVDKFNYRWDIKSIIDSIKIVFKTFTILDYIIIVASLLHYTIHIWNKRRNMHKFLRVIYLNLFFFIKIIWSFFYLYSNKLHVFIMYWI